MTLCFFHKIDKPELSLKNMKILSIKKGKEIESIMEEYNILIKSEIKEKKKQGIKFGEYDFNLLNNTKMDVDDEKSPKSMIEIEIENWEKDSRNQYTQQYLAANISNCCIHHDLYQLKYQISRVMVLQGAVKTVSSSICECMSYIMSLCFYIW